MKDLLVEVHLIDGYLNTLPIDSSRKVIDNLYGNLFAKYKIDSATFDDNLKFYLSNPVESKKLYAEINKQLTTEDTKYRMDDSIKNARITDSIRVVQHYMKLRDDAQKLILQVEIDTIPLNFHIYRADFLQRTGLNLSAYNQSTIFTNPTNTIPSTSKDVVPAAPIQSRPEQKLQRPTLEPSPKTGLRPVKGTKASGQILE